MMEDPSDVFHANAMKRRPLPAVEAQEETLLAQAWASLDWTDTQGLFLKLLRGLEAGDLAGPQTLALGCGTGDSFIPFLKAWPQAHCDVRDVSAVRLAVAGTALEPLPGLARRCRLIQDGLPWAPGEPAAYDLILSDGLLHRLAEPQILWSAIRRAGRPGARVLVMDLARPPSPGWAESLVVSYLAEAPLNLRNAFRSALFAAYAPAEVQAQLVEAGLDILEVAVVSDRHLAVLGRLPAATAS